MNHRSLPRSGASGAHSPSYSAPQMDGTHDMRTFCVRTAVRPDSLVVKPFGELDIMTTPELDTVIEQAFTDGMSHIDLDLRHLRFCSAAALTLFVRAADRCERAGGRLRLTNPTRMTARLLHITDLEGLLDADGEARI